MLKIRLGVFQPVKKSKIIIQAAGFLMVKIKDGKNTATLTVRM